MDADADFNTCGACNTDLGLITMGRRGQFCFKPGDVDDKSLLWIFQRPIAHAPIDSMFMIFQFQRDANGDSVLMSSNGFAYGSAAGGDLQHKEEWYGACPQTNPIQIYGCCGYDNLSIDNDDYLFPAGTKFSLIMSLFDVNGDCLIDLGYTKGEMGEDEGLARVAWVQQGGDRAGDTIRVDSITLQRIPDMFLE